jgi:hypothetical protein
VGDDPGRVLCHVFGELVAEVIDSRVPGLPVAERELVADTVVRIIVAMLAEYIRADDDDADRSLHELGYVVSAYMHCRYPQLIDAPAHGSALGATD